MSRSKHQRHRICRRRKEPNPILYKKEKNGKIIIIYRRIKMKPYGKKYHIGYGGEIYLRKYGEITANITNKTAERMKYKNLVKTYEEDNV